MMRQIEAVFENGVLRPLQPLNLRDSQRVRLTIEDEGLPAVQNARAAEIEWLKAHGSDYRGEWLALDGERLVSHGLKATAVRDEARAKGVERPLMVRAPFEPELPWAGWI